VINSAQLTQRDYENVMNLIEMKFNKSSIKTSLAGHLDLINWQNLDDQYPLRMAAEFAQNVDHYIDEAQAFLIRMHELLFNSYSSIPNLPLIYHTDLLTKERAFVVAQLLDVFMDNSSNNFWCIQIYEQGSIALPQYASIPQWDEHCYLLGLDAPEGSFHFSPAIVKLAWTDGYRIPLDDHVLFLKNRHRKLTARVRNINGISHSLDRGEYCRFGPAYDWFRGNLYEAFPIEGLRPSAESRLEDTLILSPNDHSR
jgi:hypothetical protein